VLPRPSNNSKNIAFHKTLNIDLYGVSSTSKVFPTCVGKFQKKHQSFYGKSTSQDD
jgi:hypothetical protein